MAEIQNHNSSEGRGHMVDGVMRYAVDIQGHYNDSGRDVR